MKKKSIIILFIIIAIINALMPMTIQATEVNELPETSDLTEEAEKSEINKGSIFSKNITFSREYIPGNGDIMPHGVITPSTASTSSSVPLIVWLHGSGEFYGGESVCMGDSNSNLLPRVLMESSLEKFHAYVLIPHSTGKDWYSSSWITDEAVKNVSTLIKHFVEEKKNVDTNNIIIAGHSMGAQGALYMAVHMEKMPYEFSKLVIVSGYEIYGSSNLTIPTRIYYGYGDNKDLDIPIAEPPIPVETGHAGAPKAAYNLDEDENGNGNNRSDLIEWMFEGYTMQGSGANTGGFGNSWVDDENDGGELVIGLAQLMCFVPDSVINLCQRMFMNDESIENDGTHSIYYSPAAIFSGTIPAFDVNFITADNEDADSYKFYIQQEENDYYNTVINDGTTNIDETDYNNYLEQAKKNEGYYIYTASHSEELNLRSDTTTIYYEELRGEQKLLCVEYFVKSTFNTDSSEYVWNYLKYEMELTDEKIQEIETANKYSSTALALQTTISTFYNALRKIALVALLSVLVYMGIRIVLTSTSTKDKAKYKKMLKDWLVALCILFTIHYIMSITVTVVEQINEVFRASTIGSNGEDVLMTTLRNDIANGEKWGDVLVQVVLYFVLAIYTIIFTIQYFRRTIYLAFLTVISPLITLTYPLDKIKDSKSQAFDMWIKDYIFFSLLQVAHLLIYYILVGSAIDLTDEGNWIFAIVAIGFLIPAEKIIKKMFGFEKSKSMGALAAGATGALVMNAINKITPKSGAKKAGDSGSKEKDSSSKIRMASKNSPTPLRDGTGSASAGGGALNGVGAVANKYGTRAIKGVMKGTAKGFVGATGAMIGLASGLAEGDISAALARAAAGGKVGSDLVGAGINMAKNTAGDIKSTINDVKDTWNEGINKDAQK